MGLLSIMASSRNCNRKLNIPRKVYNDTSNSNTKFRQIAKRLNNKLNQLVNDYNKVGVQDSHQFVHAIHYSAVNYDVSIALLT